MKDFLGLIEIIHSCIKLVGRVYQPASSHHYVSHALSKECVSILLSAVFLFWEQCLALLVF